MSETTSKSGLIITKKEGHVAWVIFNRPKKSNAFTMVMWEEAGDAIEALGKDKNIRCLIIAANGPSFLAGHDVTEIREHSTGIANGSVSKEQLFAWQQSAQRVTEICIGCDLVVASMNAQFGCPEVTLSITMTNGTTKMLAQKVGIARAREIAYLGEWWPAVEAHRIGLVNRVVPVGKEREEALKMATVIASRAPISVRFHKEMIDKATEAPLDEVLMFESEYYLKASFSKDSIEGTNAWFDDRVPNFKGE
jgi:enoyl-CoA hydratase